MHDTARSRAGAELPAATVAQLGPLLDGVAARAAEAARPLMHPRRAARVTLTLLALIAAVELLMLHGRLLAEPQASTLVRWGALWRPAVAAGEWWRVFSAMFLHGEWKHLLVNMYALFMLGGFCEELFGPLRYFVTYVAGGLCGAAASTLNTQQVGLSVGASGAIMGLLGALIVMLIVRRGTWPEAWRRALLWNLVLLGAIQIFIGFQLPMVDNAAHVGGLLGGGAMALVVAPGGLLGRSNAARAIIVAFALLGAGGFAWAAVQTARTPLERTMLQRIPQKLAGAGERLWRVPDYWKRDEEHDVLYDPYFAGDGLLLPAREPPQDPELVRLLDLIAKNAPSP